MSSDQVPDLDPSVKKVQIESEAVERFNPTEVEEQEARANAKKALAHPSRGMMFSKLKPPRATGSH